MNMNLNESLMKRACNNCSRSKVKCSGEDPCGRCTRKGLTCYFRPKKKRKANTTSDGDQDDGDNSLTIAEGSNTYETGKGGSNNGNNGSNNKRDSKRNKRSKRMEDEEISDADASQLYSLSNVGPLERRCWATFFSMFKHQSKFKSEYVLCWFTLQLCRVKNYLKQVNNQLALDRLNAWASTVGIDMSNVKLQLLSKCKFAPHLCSACASESIPANKQVAQSELQARQTAREIEQLKGARSKSNSKSATTADANSTSNSNSHSNSTSNSTSNSNSHSNSSASANANANANASIAAGTSAKNSMDTANAEEGEAEDERSSFSSHGEQSTFNTETLAKKFTESGKACLWVEIFREESRVRANESFTNLLHFTSEDLQSVLNWSGGGFLPWAGDVIARLVAREEDLLLFLQILALKFQSMPPIDETEPDEQGERLRETPTTHVFDLVKNDYEDARQMFNAPRVKCTLRIVHKEVLKDGEMKLDMILIATPVPGKGKHDKGFQGDPISSLFHEESEAVVDVGADAGGGTRGVDHSSSSSNFNSISNSISNSQSRPHHPHHRHQKDLPELQRIVSSSSSSSSSLFRHPGNNLFPNLLNDEHGAPQSPSSNSFSSNFSSFPAWGGFPSIASASATQHREQPDSADSDLGRQTNLRPDVSSTTNNSSSNNNSNNGQAELPVPVGSMARTISANESIGSLNLPSFSSPQGVPDSVLTTAANRNQDSSIHSRGNSNSNSTGNPNSNTNNNSRDIDSRDEVIDEDYLNCLDDDDWLNMVLPSQSEIAFN